VEREIGSVRVVMIVKAELTNGRGHYNNPLNLGLRLIIDLKLFRFRRAIKPARLLSSLDCVRGEISGKPNRRFVTG
jgi:hypothetical protein